MTKVGPHRIFHSKKRKAVPESQAPVNPEPWKRQPKALAEQALNPQPKALNHWVVRILESSCEKMDAEAAANVVSTVFEEARSLWSCNGDKGEEGGGGPEDPSIER